MKFKDKYVIGITGGIGSGKSMVLDIFKTEFDACIIDADKVGHMILEPEASGYKKIVEAFGTNILSDVQSDGKPAIDRKKLGSIVFTSKEKVKILNNITHPLIYDEVKVLIEASEKQLIVLEAALLTESTLTEFCDEIWFIYAKKEVRMERLFRYRGLTTEKALSIIDNQPTDEEFKKKCTVIIDNSGGKEDTLLMIKSQLQDCHDKINERIQGEDIWEI